MSIRKPPRDLPRPSRDVPIRVVCATKLSDREFFAASPTGRSLVAFGATSPAELALYPSNSTGLSEIYNRVIDESRGTPRILVFVHDDCLITDFYWSEKVRQGLERFDVLGVVGNRRRIPKQLSWIIATSDGNLDEKNNLSGAIGQGTRCPPERFDVFGPSNLECKLLDGVFLAAYSESLHAASVRFDPRFTFHFYDMDFCRSAEQCNLVMGTIPLSLIHASTGSLNEAWRSAYLTYLEKWLE